MSQTITIKGEKFVIIPAAEYKELKQRRTVPLDTRGGVLAVPFARATIARKIREAREKAGLSQAELARKAGIPVETLNRIEAGSRMPAERTMKKLIPFIGEG